MFGILEGLSLGMIEALFGNKIGLFRAVSYINKRMTVSTITKTFDNCHTQTNQELLKVREEVAMALQMKKEDEEGHSSLQDEMNKLNSLLGSFDDHENQRSNVMTKIEEALDCVRTRICNQTNRDQQAVKDFEEELFEKFQEEKSKGFSNFPLENIANSLLQKYNWSEEDWESGRENFLRLMKIKWQKFCLEKLQQEHPINPALKTLGILCANAINFVIPALAVSLLPEKIRGTAKDFLFTTLLTITADGLTNEAATSLIKPAGLLGLASFVSGWNIKTAYGLLKNRLISK